MASISELIQGLKNQTDFGNKEASSICRLICDHYKRNPPRDLTEALEVLNLKLDDRWVGLDLDEGSMCLTKSIELLSLWMDVFPTDYSAVFFEVCSQMTENVTYEKELTILLQMAAARVSFPEASIPSRLVKWFAELPAFRDHGENCFWMHLKHLYSIQVKTVLDDELKTFLSNFYLNIIDKCCLGISGRLNTLIDSVDSRVAIPFGCLDHCCGEHLGQFIGGAKQEFYLILRELLVPPQNLLLEPYLTVLNFFNKNMNVFIDLMVKDHDYWMKLLNEDLFEERLQKEISGCLHKYYYLIDLLSETNLAQDLLGYFLNLLDSPINNFKKISKIHCLVPFLKNNLTDDDYNQLLAKVLDASLPSCEYLIRSSCADGIHTTLQVATILMRDKSNYKLHRSIYLSLLDKAMYVFSNYPNREHLLFSIGVGLTAVSNDFEFLQTVVDSFISYQLSSDENFNKSDYNSFWTYLFNLHSQSEFLNFNSASDLEKMSELIFYCFFNCVCTKLSCTNLKLKNNYESYFDKLKDSEFPYGLSDISSLTNILELVALFKCSSYIKNFFFEFVHLVVCLVEKDRYVPTLYDILTAAFEVGSSKQLFSNLSEEELNFLELFLNRLIVNSLSFEDSLFINVINLIESTPLEIINNQKVHLRLQFLLESLRICVGLPPMRQKLVRVLNKWSALLPFDDFIHPLIGYLRPYMDCEKIVIDQEIGCTFEQIMAFLLKRFQEKNSNLIENESISGQMMDFIMKYDVIHVEKFFRPFSMREAGSFVVKNYFGIELTVIIDKTLTCLNPVERMDYCHLYRQSFLRLFGNSNGEFEKSKYFWTPLMILGVDQDAGVKQFFRDLMDSVICHLVKVDFFSERVVNFISVVSQFISEGPQTIRSYLTLSLHSFLQKSYTENNSIFDNWDHLEKIENEHKIPAPNAIYVCLLEVINRDSTLVESHLVHVLKKLIEPDHLSSLDSYFVDLSKRVETVLAERISLLKSEELLTMVFRLMDLFVSCSDKFHRKKCISLLSIIVPNLSPNEKHFFVDKALADMNSFYFNKFSQPCSDPNSTIELFEDKMYYLFLLTSIGHLKKSVIDPICLSLFEPILSLEEHLPIDVENKLFNILIDLTSITSQDFFDFDLFDVNKFLFTIIFSPFKLFSRSHLPPVVDHSFEILALFDCLKPDILRDFLNKFNTEIKLHFNNFNKIISVSQGSKCGIPLFHTCYKFHLLSMIIRKFYNNFTLIEIKTIFEPCLEIAQKISHFSFHISPTILKCLEETIYTYNGFLLISSQFEYLVLNIEKIEHIFQLNCLKSLMIDAPKENVKKFIAFLCQRCNLDFLIIIFDVIHTSRDMPRNELIALEMLKNSYFISSKLETVGKERSFFNYYICLGKHFHRLSTGIEIAKAIMNSLASWFKNLIETSTPAMLIRICDMLHLFPGMEYFFEKVLKRTKVMKLNFYEEYYFWDCMLECFKKTNSILILKELIKHFHFVDSLQVKHVLQHLIERKKSDTQESIIVETIHFVFMDSSLDVKTSNSLLSYLTFTLECCSEQSVIDFFFKILSNLTNILSTDYLLGCHKDYKQLMNCSRCFIILKNLFDRVGSKIADNENFINFYGKKRINKHLATVIEEYLRSSKKEESENYCPSFHLDVINLKSHAYNCLVSIFCNFEHDPVLFSYYLFKEDVIWMNLLCDRCVKLEDCLLAEWPLPLEAVESCALDCHLFDFTLQRSFDASKGGNQLKRLNDHPSMDSICRVVRMLSSKNLRDPCFIKRIARAVTYKGSSNLTRLFILKIIHNCQESLKPYSNHLLHAIIVGIINGACGLNFNSFLNDVLLMILSWPPSLENKGITNKLVNYLILNFISKRQSQMIEIFKEIGKRWKNLVDWANVGLVEVILDDNFNKSIGAIEICSVWLSLGLQPYQHSERIKISQQTLSIFNRVNSIPTTRDLSAISQLLGHILVLNEKDEEELNSIISIFKVMSKRKQAHLFHEGISQIRLIFPKIVHYFVDDFIGLLCDRESIAYHDEVLELLIETSSLDRDHKSIVYVKFKNCFYFDLMKKSSVQLQTRCLKLIYSFSECLSVKRLKAFEETLFSLQSNVSVPVRILVYSILIEALERSTASDVCEFKANLLTGLYDSDKEIRNKVFKYFLSSGKVLSGREVEVTLNLLESLSKCRPNRGMAFFKMIVQVLVAKISIDWDPSITEKIDLGNRVDRKCFQLSEFLNKSTGVGKKSMSEAHCICDPGTHGSWEHKSPNKDHHKESIATCSLDDGPSPEINKRNIYVTDNHCNTGGLDYRTNHLELVVDSSEFLNSLLSLIEMDYHFSEKIFIYLIENSLVNINPVMLEDLKNKLSKIISKMIDSGSGGSFINTTMILARLVELNVLKFWQDLYILKTNQSQRNLLSLFEKLFISIRDAQKHEKRVKFIENKVDFDFAIAVLYKNLGQFDCCRFVCKNHLDDQLSRVLMAELSGEWDSAKGIYRGFIDSKRYSEFMNMVFEERIIECEIKR